MSQLLRYANTFFLGLAVALTFTACSTEDDFFADNGKEAVVTFVPTISDDMATRAIGDGTMADRLLVRVYEGPTQVMALEQDFNTAVKDGIQLTLIEGRTYKVLFLAVHNDNTAYSVGEGGNITVNYEDYLEGGFAKMEELDIFCYAEELTVEEGNSKTIKLLRPTAQLNFADENVQPIIGTHKAVVTLNGIPTSYDPFRNTTGDITDDLVFTFTDFSEEKLNIHGNLASYVTTNYIFVPQSGTISATIDIQTLVDDKSLKKSDVEEIKLEANKRTNVLGEIVMMPVTVSTWNGKDLTQPESAAEDKNRYIIDAASDIAWLQSDENNLIDAGTFLVTTDIDMAGYGISSLKIPAGSTIMSDGNEARTIKNMKVSGGLFGGATNLSVSNLNIKDITVNSTTTHVGALVNTLKGSGTFSGVTVTNAQVSTNNGAAGGMIGYIVRESENNREELLNVSISNCHVSNTTINGSLSEGHFVGLLRGYDNGETLTFDTDCSATGNTITDVSMYKEGNEGEWLAANDYTNFNGWLGNEECYRAIVNYGDNRFVPKWDGTTKITPLTDGTTKLIYSAFDLASLQGGGHTAATFKENVDLGGDRTSKKNPFNPISSISTLDGGNNTLYNLYIEVSTWIGGFIQQADGQTVHKNLTFQNSAIIVNTIPTEEHRYAGTLCPYINSGNYTASSIKVNKGYIKGLSKVGGVIGFITAGCDNATIENCSVSESNIENVYLQVEGETFPASGEIGGLIGFISAKSSSSVVAVSNCSVNNTHFNCCTYKAAALWDRSVAELIGDIRTQNGETIRINNYSVNGNTYTNCQTGNSEAFDQIRVKTGGTFWNPKYTYFPIGQCYHINFVITDPRDTKGNVTIDGTTVY